jgi:phage shock protein PspC (stress-responsive transcriptional regulator)
VPFPVLPAILGYFIAWIVIPEAPYPVPAQTPSAPQSVQTA